MKRTSNKVLFLVALVLVLSSTIVAQEVTANLTGTVKDTTGAVVPGDRHHYGFREESLVYPDNW